MAAAVNQLGLGGTIHDVGNELRASDKGQISTGSNSASDKSKKELQSSTLILVDCLNHSQPADDPAKDAKEFIDLKRPQ